jgi:hypothetical protein
VGRRGVAKAGQAAELPGARVPRGARCCAVAAGLLRPLNRSSPSSSSPLHRLFPKAGAVKEREGDYLAAIGLYLKGGLPGRAAQVRETWVVPVEQRGAVIPR